MNKIADISTSSADEILLGQELTRFIHEKFPSTCQDEFLETFLYAISSAFMRGNLCLDVNAEKELFDQNFKPETLINKLRFHGLIKQDQPSFFKEENGKIYLQKMWRYEEELVEWIRRKSRENDITFIHQTNKEMTELAGIVPSEKVDHQDIGVVTALLKKFVVITGAPGTGKTYTMQRILRSHIRGGVEATKIALAAPTGKAARRMNESLQNSDDLLNYDLNTTTVHKLLGSDLYGSNFRYNEENKLKKEVIIIDEASMIDINLWIRLIRAIPDYAKLILLGDMNQLSSVEAGSILGDICTIVEYSDNDDNVTEMIQKLKTVKSGLNSSIVYLTKSYRFGENSGIKLLADAIQKGDSEDAIRILESDDYPDVNLIEDIYEDFDKVSNTFGLTPYDTALKAPEGSKLSAFNEYKLLCAVRKGPYGVEEINRLLERKIKRNWNIPLSTDIYSHKILISNKNNSLVRVRNGEMGVCIRNGDGSFDIVMENDKNRRFKAHRLGQSESAYAITIHKSQGSEFNNVGVVLPSEILTILSRELLYTSVTRARSGVLVYGKKDIIEYCISNEVSRKSGISNKLSTKK